MKKQNLIFTRVILISIVASVIFLMIGFSQIQDSGGTGTISTTEAVDDQKDLVVLWTSGDPEVASKMLFMYTYNAKKFNWWENITLIVWGPSAKLLSEHNELQHEVTKMKKEGVVLKACKACADSYGVTPKLEELGIEVIYMGKELTEYLKGEGNVLAI
jgi:hypothetical protein